MSFNAQVYRVLIASPGDLDEERDVIERAVHSWNASHAVEEKAVLLPVRWETHSTPEYGDRAQAILNRQLVVGCDMLIGAFWTRVGTPTGDFESGTLEEIEQITSAGKPALLYFSSRQIDPDKVDLDQLKRVRELRTRIQSKALIDAFASPLELEAKLSRHLVDRVRRLARKDHQPGADTTIVEPDPPSGVTAPGSGRSAPMVDEAALGLLYLEYWTQFEAAFRAVGIGVRAPTPSSRNYVRFSVRSSSMRMNAFASVRDRLIGVELVLSSPDADNAYSTLERHRNEIELQLGEKLEWNKRQASHRIVLSSPGYDPMNRLDWPRQHAWLIQRLDAFRICLLKRIEG